MTRRSCLLWLPIAMLAAGQQSDDSEVRTRQLWDTTLLNQRPNSAKPPAGKHPAPTPVKGALIGITVWRLRPSRPGDAPEVRAMIHEDTAGQEWTPERVAAGTPLTEGQKVRISVEPAKPGYLYIIDQDEYADGTKSDAYLIFPTQRTRAGDNHVIPGMVVEIPAPDDNPPYFKVQRSRPDQVSEVLTLLVSPKPISGLQIGRQRIRLAESQVMAWEKQWKTSAARLEAVDQEGKPYTVAEKQAGSGRKLLTADDPLPQTMYRVDSKPGETILLQLPLRITK